MKKNAFTLVELLAVIVLLAIIMLIAYPSVFSTINKNKIASYNSFVNNIHNVTHGFLLEFPSEVTWTNDKEGYVTINQLSEKGYIPTKIRNPENKELINSNTKVYIKKQPTGNNVYEIENYPIKEVK